jgi:hypothetical protein
VWVWVAVINRWVGGCVSPARTIQLWLFNDKWYVANTFCHCGAVQQVLHCHIAKLSLVPGTEACVRVFV